MSIIRNDYGGGHGRARQPELTGEMLDLAIDGSLLWTRWALRRFGYFARGRPETLIRDLVGDPGGQIVFYSGDLSARLQSADLPKIEPRYFRSIGIAVGQRAARDTFNVRIEGRRPSLGDRRPRALAEQLPPRRRQRPTFRSRRTAHNQSGNSSLGARGVHPCNRRGRRDHNSHPTCHGDTPVWPTVRRCRTECRAAVAD